MRFVARFISLALLVAAVIAGVLDSIQSVAGSALALAPLGATISSLKTDLMSQAEALAVANLGFDLSHPAVAWSLRQPTSGVLLALSLLFWLLAYKRQPAAGRFAA